MGLILALSLILILILQLSTLIRDYYETSRAKQSDVPIAHVVGQVDLDGGRCCLVGERKRKKDRHKFASLNLQNGDSLPVHEVTQIKANLFT